MAASGNTLSQGDTEWACFLQPFSPNSTPVTPPCPSPALSQALCPKHSEDAAAWQK